MWCIEKLTKMKNYKLLMTLVLFMLSYLNFALADSDNSGNAVGKTPVKKTRITIVKASTEDLMIIEKSIGHLESVQAPKVSVEITGRLEEIKVDVGDFVTKGQLLAVVNDKDLRLLLEIAKTQVKRLEALIRSQKREVKRQRNMVGDKFSSQSLLDQAQAQLEALEQQYAGAKANATMAEYSLSKHNVFSPIDGQVESRLVSIGNFLRNGDVLFQINAIDKLQAFLPFPETLASRIKPGLTVKMATPTAPGTVALGKVREIRPVVNTKNKAIYVIVDVNNPGNWKPGATVSAELILEQHNNAVTVPETAVVNRPIGKVVYIVENSKAIQQRVVTGINKEGNIEIISGLHADQVIAMDGAGFLTDQAPVSIQGSK